MRRFTDRPSKMMFDEKHHLALVLGGRVIDEENRSPLFRITLPRYRLVIFDEPTRGVDVGAIAEIHSIIKGLADDGLAVMVISSYLPEVLNLSDRILVARQGRIVEEFSPEEATEETIMYAAVH